MAAINIALSPLWHDDGHRHSNLDKVMRSMMKQVCPSYCARLSMYFKQAQSYYGM